jgi:hypothetical protein
MTLIRIRRRVSKIAGVEWIQDGARKTFASAHYKIHQDALKTVYELGHRGTKHAAHPLQPEHAQGRSSSALGHIAVVIGCVQETRICLEKSCGTAGRGV